MAELDGRVAVLVEGESDRAAVLALAARRGVDLDGVEVVAMGGVTNVARYVAELGPRGRGLRLTGLYDAAEERFVRGGLERGGSGRGRTWPSSGSTGASATSRTS
jgi:acylphosphatase